MKTYFTRKRSGEPSEIMEAKKSQNVKMSGISDTFVKIEIGKNEVFFTTTEYDAAGFSLDGKELEKILAELKTRENNK